VNKLNSRFGKKGVAKPSEGLQEPSKTQQNFKEGADINRIASRHLGGGTFANPLGNMPLGNPNATRKLVFGDFSNAEDFHTMSNRVIDARSQFQALPGRLRSRFNNDPYQLMRWLEDPKNEPLAKKYGLLPGDLDPRDQIDLIDELDKQAKTKEWVDKKTQEIRDSLKADIRPPVAESTIPS